MKRDQKTRGRFLGGSRPFGWQITDDGSLEPLESERKALLVMRRMHKAGASLRTIAAAMQAARLCNLAPRRQEGTGARRRDRVKQGWGPVGAVSACACL